MLFIALRLQLVVFPHYSTVSQLLYIFSHLLILIFLRLLRLFSNLRMKFYGPIFHLSILRKCDHLLIGCFNEESLLIHTPCNKYLNIGFVHNMCLYRTNDLTYRIHDNHRLP